MNPKSKLTYVSRIERAVFTIVFATLLSFNSNAAGTSRWTGSISTDWGTSGNWTTVSGTPSAPPGSGDVVDIPTTPSGSRFPTISSAANAISITINPSATLTLTSGGTLTLYGDISGAGTFIITGGTLTSSGAGAGDINNPQIWSGNFTFGSGGADANYSGAIALAGNTAISWTKSAHIITYISGGINADAVGNNRTLTITGTGENGDLIFTGSNIGGAQALKSISITGVHLVNLDDIALNNGNLTIGTEQAIYINGNVSTGGGSVNLTSNHQSSIFSSNGVTIATGKTMYTGSGNIIISGEGNSGGGSGVLIDGTLQTTSGNITITGHGFAQGFRGVHFNLNGGIITSASGAISLTGTADLSAGIRINPGCKITSTGTATITLEGRATSGFASMQTISASTLGGGSGNITLIATSGNGGDLAGVISGSGQLIKQGSVTLTLSGANTYTGATLVNAGTLDAGAASVANTSGAFGNNSAVTLDNTSGASIDITGFNTQIGSLAGGGTTGGNCVLGAAVLTTGLNNANTSYAGVISGTGGSIIKLGTGEFSLTNANTYTGGTTLYSGTININNSSALGTSAGTFAINGGTIDNTSAADITMVNYPLELNADFTYSGSVPHNLNLGAGTTTFSASRQITVTAGVLGLGGVITHSGLDLTKAGVGTLSFGAQAVSLNDVSVSVGTLISTSNTLTLAGNYTNNGTFTHNSGIVSFNNSADKSIGGSVKTVFNNLIKNGAGRSTLGSPIDIVTNLNLTNGIVYTDATNLVNFYDNASVTGGSNTTHINGPVKKTGNDAFVFPTGKGGRWARASISAPGSTADQYVAEYFETPYTDLSVTSGVNTISHYEYWNITRPVGSSAVNLALYFESGTFSGITSINPADILVSNYNGADWADLAGTDGTTGTTSAGTVSMTGVNNYSPGFFTFGSPNGNNPLPIKLISFTASCGINVVILNWTTATEINSDFFTIETSHNGINWTAIKHTKAAGNSMVLMDYSAMITDPSFETNYYRLKQTDLDGKFEYSTIIAAKNCGTNLDRLSIFPNPCQGVLNLNYNGNTENSIYMELFNITGTIVFKSTSAQNQLDITALTPGIYYAHVLNRDESLIKKIVIEK